jgi:hypothetical protein
MAQGEIPEPTDFFKKTTITEEECRSFCDSGWLSGSVITIPEVDVPTVDGLNVLYFESHLLARLGLPPVSSWQPS